jgi:hypothetical protein
MNNGKNNQLEKIRLIKRKEEERCAQYRNRINQPDFFGSMKMASDKSS